MNNTRRKEIKNLITQCEILKDRLSSILDDEQDYYDNMPENLQGSMRGCDSEDAIDYLNNALELVGDAIDELGNII